ncbi:MAG: fasciclin domain-containing protein [Chloroflexi bacterium]|nr:fasciclin domain-containing protein [Chloroflexota bacterium]
MKKMFSLFSVLMVAALVLAACAPAATPMPEPTPVPPTQAPEPTAVPTEAPKTIVDIAVEDGRFTTLVAAVQAAGLAETLSGEGPFTVFAPTDDAFAKLPEGTVEALLADIPALSEILLYHVVPGAVMAEQVVELKSAETAAGIDVRIKVMDGKVFINEAEVLITDIEASNGVIHVIDSVILPPADIVDIAVADGRFTTLVAAVQAAGLVETLKGEGPFTVFAPTDDAFAKLPEGTIEALLADTAALSDILLYHVVPGEYYAEDVLAMPVLQSAQGSSLLVKLMEGKAMLNDAEIIITDIPARNGVIHVIDTVVTPGNIVETAVKDGRFTTLAAALQAANLVEALQGEGPFTVFAPTDDAFAKLPEGTVEALLADIPTLSNILLYHVVEGSVKAADVAGLSNADSLAAEKLNIMIDGEKVMINDAQVIIADIVTTNGVIHVIDTVLQPRDIVDTAVADGRFTTLAAALEAAGLIETLKGEGPFTVFAPTDDAFAKLPEGTVEALLADIPALTNILTYHVVAGEVYAADVVNLESAATVQGQPVSIKVEDGKVFINEAQVIITDIAASNGVIHVIDSVILPPQ